MSDKKIIYHKNCMDGSASAVIAREVLGDDSEMIPAQYGDEPPKLSPGDHVYILDFSYKREILMAMEEAAEYLIVLDHHKTAEEELRGLDYCEFDMGRSGCALTWDFFKGQEPYPWWVSYMQDRDVGLWKEPSSRAVNAGMRSYGISVDAIANFRFLSAPQMREEGFAILRYEEQLIDQHANHAIITDFLGYKVPMVEATCLQSAIGNRLSKGHPFSVTYFNATPEEVVFSLRSSEDGIDVGDLAKKNGGGGHKHAAGFKMKRSAHANTQTQVR